MSTCVFAILMVLVAFGIFLIVMLKHTHKFNEAKDLMNEVLDELEKQIKDETSDLKEKIEELKEKLK